MTSVFTAARTIAGTGRRPRVLFSTNRYRTYDRRIYETLADAFDLRILWVNPPPPDEAIPAWPDTSIRWRVVDDDPAILTAFDVRRSARLLRISIAEARQCDLVVGATPGSWRSRVLFAAAGAARVPIAYRSDIWRDVVSGAAGGLNARVQRRITRWMERRAAAVLVSGVKAAAHAAESGVARERILPFRYLHPDLFARSRDTVTLDRLRAIKGGRVAFLYLGRVMEQKGLLPLIQAFRAVLDTGRDAVLMVVGAPITEDDGRGRVSESYFAAARRLAADESRIVFLGQAAPADVHNYYAAADVFVHPHVASVDGHDVHESWGNVITEAACMGMPIIATDRIPAAFDIVETGRNGYLLPAERLVAELPGALRSFVDAPELVARYGRESRRRYEVFADPTLNITALERVITCAQAER